MSLKNILKGKIFNVDGILYTPLYANKKGKQYRYYVSQHCMQNRHHPKGVISRLPAHEIETLVQSAIITEMRDLEKLSGMLEHISKSVDAEQDLSALVHKVIVDTDCLTVEICVKNLIAYINNVMRIGLKVDDEARIHSLTIPYHTKRARQGAVVIRTGDGKDLLDLLDLLDLPKSKLESLVKGIIWREEHFKGKRFEEIA